MKKLVNNFLLFAVASTSVFAQTTGEVRGVVADATGASIANAKVAIASRSRGESRAVETDAEGRFAAPLLAVGEYEIKVEKAGFRSTSTRAEIKTGEIASARIVLELGQVTESVSVSGAVRGSTPKMLSCKARSPARNCKRFLSNAIPICSS